MPGHFSYARWKLQNRHGNSSVSGNRIPRDPADWKVAEVVNVKGNVFTKTHGYSDTPDIVELKYFRMWIAIQPHHDRGRAIVTVRSAESRLKAGMISPP